MENVSYLRVSSPQQNFDRQLEGMPKNIDKQFLEKASAAQTAQRKVLPEMLDYVRDGDHLWVHSLDRLARSMKDLLRLLESLEAKGVTVTFIKENTSPLGLRRKQAV